MLTITLVSLNMALLGSAEIQSVNGLAGAHRRRHRPALAVSRGAGRRHRSSSGSNVTARHPLVDRRLFRGRTVLVALFVNFVVGAGLVIAMVDVPLFINSVEIDLDRAAVISGLILSAMTAAMAIASYLGGRLTERTWFKPPVLIGVAMASAAYAWMGATWSADTSYPVFALQLALLGAGFGLTVAPTTNAVVDSAPADQRGAAASVVMVVRLLGLSVGLSALTAWGLGRFNDLRSTIELPPLTDPDFESALLAAQETLTAQAIAETFTAAAVVLGAGLLATFAMRRQRRDRRQHDGRPTRRRPDGGDPDTTRRGHRSGRDHGRDAGRRRRDPPAASRSPSWRLLQKRTNLILGGLGVLLAVALVAIALLFGRVADAQDDAVRRPRRAGDGARRSRAGRGRGRARTPVRSRASRTSSSSCSRRSRPASTRRSPDSRRSATRRSSSTWRSTR